MYVDHGLTGTDRDRPGLRRALAACRAGDTLVVTKLDRLARSVPDARAIAEELTAGEVKLNLGRAVYDPTDPVGRLLFNVLAMVAEFEAQLTRERTQAGLAAASDRGRPAGRPSVMTDDRCEMARKMLDSGYEVAQVARAPSASAAPPSPAIFLS